MFAGKSHLCVLCQKTLRMILFNCLQWCCAVNNSSGDPIGGEQRKGVVFPSVHGPNCVALVVFAIVHGTELPCWSSQVCMILVLRFIGGLPYNAWHCVHWWSSKSRMLLHCIGGFPNYKCAWYCALSTKEASEEYSLCSSKVNAENTLCHFTLREKANGSQERRDKADRKKDLYRIVLFAHILNSTLQNGENSCEVESSATRLLPWRRRRQTQ